MVYFLKSDNICAVSMAISIATAVNGLCAHESAILTPQTVMRVEFHPHHCLRGDSGVLFPELCSNKGNKQRVLMHGHQGWNVRHRLCHIYMRYVYIYIWVVYSLCFFCCLFITVTWWYVWCIEWASGNQEEVQACLVTLWLFIISCYSLYKTTLGLLCSWFENNPHFHKYSMDFHV